MDRFMKYLFLGVLVAMTYLLFDAQNSAQVSSQPVTPNTETTIAPQPTPPADFVFFNGDGKSASKVFDASQFTKAAITIRCGAGTNVALLVSADKKDWIVQYEYGSAECVKGQTQSVELSGRYYIAIASGGELNIRMIGRFSD
jgi:hypothetical protein